MTVDSRGPSISRRDLLKTGAFAGGALAFGGALGLPVSAVRAQDRQAEQSLVVAMAGLQPTLDPGIDWTFSGGSIIFWAYDGLYRNVGEEKVETIPALADGMPEISADGLTWTIKLRQGRVFHDGSPVTADDVKFTYDRQFNYEMPGSARSTLPMIASVEVVDPLTVRFNLSTPTPWLLAILGDPWANAVVSKALVEANTAADETYPGEKWLAINDAGAGPYKITSFEPAVRVEMTRDPNWPDWTEGPHLENATFINVTEPATQRLMFERGEVDIATDLTPEDVEALITRPGLKYHDFFTDETLTFNFGDWAGQPWEDKRVRQALLSAFNFEVAGQLAAGYQPVACGVPPQLQNFNGCAVHYTYDLAAATALLAEAGFADGFEINVNAIQGDAIATSLLQMWQADLGSIGVTMNITTLPNAVIFPGKVKEPSLYGLGSIYVEPMGWLYFWSRPAPDGFWWYNPWYNPDYEPAAQFRALVDQAAVEQDNTARAALYTQAIDIFQSEWVWGHFLQPRRRIVFNEALQGYTGFYRQGTYAVPLTSLSWA